MEQRGSLVVADRFRESASESDRLTAILSGVLRTAPPTNAPAED